MIQNKQSKDNLIDSSFIRTMEKDIAALKGVEVKQNVVASPPPSLPVVEPDKKQIKRNRLSIFSYLLRLFKSKPKPIKSKIEPDISKKRLEVSKKLFSIISIAIMLIIVGMGGFFYWLNYLKVVPVIPVVIEEQSDVKPDIVIPIPESLISINETKTIELVTDQENLLSGQLKVLVSQEQSTTTIDRILVKMVDKYLVLNDLILALNINIPENIATSTTENYTLFSYGHEQGNRLGIVIQMGESDTLVQDLIDWEATIKDDLKELFLIENLSDAATEEFQDKIHNDVYIRYMNFPTPDLSLDYALINGNLVIATSRESMFAIIDKLLE